LEELSRLEETSISYQEKQESWICRHDLKGLINIDSTHSKYLSSLYVACLMLAGGQGTITPENAAEYVLMIFVRCHANLRGPEPSTPSTPKDRSESSQPGKTFSSAAPARPSQARPLLKLTPAHGDRLSF